jgi:hypothetical protein
VIINRRTGPASLCCLSQKGEFFGSSHRFELAWPLLMSALGQKRTLLGHRPLTEGRLTSVRLVSDANGISALALKVLVIS